MKHLFAVICVLSVSFATSSRAAELAVLNPGFEEPIGGRPGWGLSQHAGVIAFEMERDDKVFAEGRHSFRMKRHTEQVYGLIDQRISAGDSAGETMRFSAMLRTDGVGPKGWMLVVNFLGDTGGIMGQVRSQPMTGTSDWRRVTLEEKIPIGTHQLTIGAMLLDSGTGWVDDIELSTGGD